MHNKVIGGSKGGQKKPRQPTEMEDNLISINKIKVLLAVSDGELDEEFSLKNLYLGEVPVQASNGTMNYEGVTAEFRPGTQTQDYIKGFTEGSNEINVNREFTTQTPFIVSVTNTNLSAVRFKIYLPRGVKTTNEGDRLGITVQYAIDMAVDGGSYKEALRRTINGKTTSGYDQSVRVNLPSNFNSVLLRVRRITPDSDTDMVVDKLMVMSYSEVIDAKFRYPLTGLVYVEFDSKLFPNQLPTISVKKRWKLINVPSNYDPDSRTYSGTWNGLFKKAWSNNPAWVLYDLISNQRYGLDQRELGISVDKWTLYEAGQYCDQMVPDGKGGTEPRYLCDVVIQSQIEAYTLVRDICSIFRGMSFWNGESLSIVIDRKRDPAYIFTNDNVVGGQFQYTFASEKSMYTCCNVTFDDRENMYSQDVEPVFDYDAALRFGHNPTSITAIGCTRRSEANRRGRWILKTNLRNTVINFATGLEGMIPTIGDVVAIADNFWSSNLTLNLSGRVMEVSGLQVFTAFRVDARAGDFIMINKPDGIPVKRTISKVSADGKTIELNVGFGFDVKPDTVFAIDRPDVALQQYVVTSVTRGDGDEEFTYSISAVEYDPNKYDAIDYGVNVDDRPTSVVDPDNTPAPKNVKVSSYSRVVQGLSVETMVVGWDKVQYASLYEVQWRKGDGNWNNIPRTANTEVEVEGIYAGNYSVRVRAISTADIAGPYSEIVNATLTGKVGEPPMPVNLTATENEVFGIRVKWGMPTGSGDTAYIELQQSPDGSEENASLLTMVPYPQFEYWHSILPAGYVNHYRIRSVDKIGNQSAWTPFVRGMASDDASLITEVIKIDIKDSDGYKELNQNAVDIANKIRDIAQGQIHNALANDKDVRRMTVENGKRKAEFLTSVQLIADESSARATAISQLTAQVNDEIMSSITRMDEAIANESEARAQAIAQLEAQINDEIGASITEIQTALANETEARAEADTALTSRLGDAEAAISQKMTSYVDATGPGAMYALNLGLKYKGVEYKAGMNISLETNSSGAIYSQVLFDADRFAIIKNGAGDFTLPFVVQNGQVIINSAVIGTGMITNAMIGNVIQSNDYVAGQRGWRLDKNGNFEINGQNGNGRLTISNSIIQIYDSNGTRRVRMGLW